MQTIQLQLMPLMVVMRKTVFVVREALGRLHGGGVRVDQDRLHVLLTQCFDRLAAIAAGV